VTRVWLIRHGASTASPALAIGVSDPPLSDLGRAQARNLAVALSARPLVRVISSDLRRAMETATIVAAQHRIAVETSAALREIDFGTWEGRDLRDLWSEDPAAAGAWEKDIRLTPRDFGESVSDLEHRVAAFWRHSLPLPDTGEVAIVGHGGSLAALRALISHAATATAVGSRLDLGAMIGLDAS
jgi:glucosyl-3-phosphoglycerate phosphatase